MADILFWSRLANVFSFCVLFGMSIWVGIISGPIMFKTLARHQFSLIQSKLFPLFFWLCVALTGVCFGTFYYENPYTAWKGMTLYQGGSLLLSFMLYLVNAVYIVPVTNNMTFKTRKYEREVGAGSIKPGALEEEKEKLLMKNTDYAHLKKKFGMFHGISMLTTMVAILSLLVHMSCLAGNLSRV